MLVYVLLEAMNSVDQGCRKRVVIFVMIKKFEEICWWVLSDLEFVLFYFFFFFCFVIFFSGT